MYLEYGNNKKKKKIYNSKLVLNRNIQNIHSETSIGKNDEDREW